MNTFQYSLGDRPLDGYTIKRGIGKGGFGEVYFALSDGGKEVAIKLIRSNLEVELRGMRQCLNLKHANLVGLFDLRKDRQGNHWVVMEYVTGESMFNILQRYPGGLDVDLAREWFLGLADAIHYLHDQGIVHRDLKPANIFLENGTIKVGDYGLCKFIGGSQHHGQTESVGTVYYMAPEISTGNYNRQIDVYAAGVILFEMLTGRVPFTGQTAGEILMKHLTSSPDLRGISAKFVPILERALCKNPAHRYRTISEMAKDVRAIGEEQSAPQDASAPGMLKYEPRVISEEIVKPPSAPTHKRVTEVCGSLLTSALLAAMLAVFWAAIVRSDSIWNVAGYFLLTVSCCWIVIVAANLYQKNVEDSWKRRATFLGLGLAIGLEAIWLQGYHLPDFETMQLQAAGEQRPNDKVAVDQSPAPPRAAKLSVVAAYLTYFGLIFFVMRWWKIADRRRPQRFSLYPVLAAGFWAYFLQGMFSHVLHTPLAGANERFHGLVALVMAAIIIQLVSPWERPAPARVRRVRLRYA